MDLFKRLARKINSSVITRNLVLAACAIIVFVFIVNILLGMFTRHGQVHEVPDMRGLSMEEAHKMRHSGRLRIEINDSLFVPQVAGGVILDQNPVPGAKVKSGRTVFVTINSFAQKKVVIPYVTGYSLRQAKNNLEVAGLQIDRLVYKSDIATKNVLEEIYDGKTIRKGSNVEAEVGSGVTLVVGVSAEDAVPQAVPRTVGYSLREAKSRLWETGFNVGKITKDEGIDLMNEKDAKVYVQSPSVGARRGYGTPVDLSITLDETKITKGIKESDRASRAAARALADSLAAAEAAE